MINSNSEVNLFRNTDCFCIDISIFGCYIGWKLIRLRCHLWMIFLEYDFHALLSCYSSWYGLRWLPLFCRVYHSAIFAIRIVLLFEYLHEYGTLLSKYHILPDSPLYIFLTLPPPKSDNARTLWLFIHLFIGP